MLLSKGGNSRGGMFGGLYTTGVIIFEGPSVITKKWLQLLLWLQSGNCERSRWVQNTVQEPPNMPVWSPRVIPAPQRHATLLRQSFPPQRHATLLRQAPGGEYCQERAHDIYLSYEAAAREQSRGEEIVLCIMHCMTSNDSRWNGRREDALREGKLCFTSASADALEFKLSPFCVMWVCMRHH